MIAGVCNGLGVYFGIDPTIVRVTFALLTLATHGWWILVYFVLMVVIPEAETSEQVAAAPRGTVQRAGVDRPRADEVRPPRPMAPSVEVAATSLASGVAPLNGQLVDVGAAPSAELRCALRHGLADAGVRVRERCGVRVPRLCRLLARQHARRSGLVVAAGPACLGRAAHGVRRLPDRDGAHMRDPARCPALVRRPRRVGWSLRAHRARHDRVGVSYAPGAGARRHPAVCPEHSRRLAGLPSGGRRRVSLQRYLTSLAMVLNSSVPARSSN